jgi:hypothetical protein
VSKTDFDIYRYFRFLATNNKILKLLFGQFLSLRFRGDLVQFLVHKQFTLDCLLVNF